MTTHTEWVRARDAHLEYAEHEDAYGTRSEGRALLVGTDSTVAIEGTPEELTLLLGRMLSLVKRYSTATAADEPKDDPIFQRLAAHAADLADAVSTDSSDIDVVALDLLGAVDELLSERKKETR